MVYLRLLYGFIGRLYDLLAAILIATLIIGAQAIPEAYALSESQITDQTVAAKGTITMDAVIDGRSQLILHGIWRSGCISILRHRSAGR